MKKPLRGTASSSPSNDSWACFCRAGNPGIAPAPRQKNDFGKIMFLEKNRVDSKSVFFLFRKSRFWKNDSEAESVHSDELLRNATPHTNPFPRRYTSEDGEGLPTKASGQHVTAYAVMRLPL